MSYTHAQLEEMAREAMAVDYVAGACMACILFDHMLTLGDEVKGMWRGRLSVPKMLFFLNRYLVEAILVFNAVASARNRLSIGFCVFYLRWLVCTITVTNTVVEGILVARVWALYRSNILVMSIAILFYLGGIMTLVGLTVDDYIGQGPVQAVNDFNALPGCYAATVPDIIAGYWIAPVIIESILFSLIVSRAFMWWKQKERVPPTLMLLARDSTVYFAVIFVLLIVNLFVFEYGPPFLSSMMVTPSNTAGCIAGSRMLLNLRNLACDDNYEMTTTRSRIIFASRLKFKRKANTDTTQTTTTDDYAANTQTLRSHLATTVRGEDESASVPGISSVTDIS